MQLVLGLRVRIHQLDMTIVNLQCDFVTMSRAVAVGGIGIDCQYLSGVMKVFGVDYLDWFFGCEVVRIHLKYVEVIDCGR